MVRKEAIEAATAAAGRAGGVSKAAAEPELVERGMHVACTFL